MYNIIFPGEIENINFCVKLLLLISSLLSGVARASPRGRVAHPESQNEEEKE